MLIKFDKEGVSSGPSRVASNSAGETIFFHGLAKPKIDVRISLVTQTKIPLNINEIIYNLPTFLYMTTITPIPYFPISSKYNLQTQI